jgi:type I restriction enzyme M protein
MVGLTGNPDTGNKINTQVIQPLIDANRRLARSDFPDFYDPNKLGDGQARLDRLGNLIAIFAKPELDFSKNRAAGEDAVGEAGDDTGVADREDEAGVTVLFVTKKERF